jgi:hypothetical protein
MKPRPRGSREVPKKEEEEMDCERVQIMKGFLSSAIIWEKSQYYPPSEDSLREA